jgi:AraC-like DNA-binding protein
MTSVPQNSLAAIGRLISLGLGAEQRQKLTKQIESGFSPRTFNEFSETKQGKEAWDSYLALLRNFFGFAFDPARCRTLQSPFEVTLKAIAVTPNLAFARVQGSAHQVAALPKASNSNLFYDFHFARRPGSDVPEIRLFDWLQPVPLDSSDTLVVIISRAKLETITGNLSHLCGQQLEVDERYARLVGDFFFSAFDSLMHNDSVQVEASIVAAMVNLLMGICSPLKTSNEKQGNRPTLLRLALRYIDTNYLDPKISPSTISAKLNISQSYLYDIFAAQNISVSDEIWDRRISRAHKMLQEASLSKKSISEIASACGFTSQAHFSRRFKERYGISPTAFRKTASARRPHRLAEANG